MLSLVMRFNICGKCEECRERIQSDSSLTVLATFSIGGPSSSTGMN